MAMFGLQQVLRQVRLNTREQKKRRSGKSG